MEGRERTPTLGACEQKSKSTPTSHRPRPPVTVYGTPQRVRSCRLLRCPMTTTVIKAPANA